MHADERGSIISGGDSTGTATATIAYDEYGRPSRQSGNHSFAGTLVLGVSGLTYNRARVYDAAPGRFLQADPIGYGDGMNMYGYVRGDPVNWTDPSGMIATNVPTTTTTSVGELTDIIVTGPRFREETDHASSELLQRLRRDHAAPETVETACFSIFVIPCRVVLGRIGVTTTIAVGIPMQTRLPTNRRARTPYLLQEGEPRPPAGSRPIDQTPWSGDHNDIKRGIGAGPSDNVRIGPGDHVWEERPDGSWIDHGPAGDFTESGQPSGMRGRDRGRR